MPRDNLPKVVRDCHDLLTWLIPSLDHLPRNRRFTLGERLESSLIEILELLVEAAYSRTKQQVLQRANIRLAVVRHLWRMAHELDTIPGKRYAHGTKLMDDPVRREGVSRVRPPWPHLPWTSKVNYSLMRVERVKAYMQRLTVIRNGLNDTPMS